ncbi:large ribosomal subunit protein mL45-like isoform X2 [Oscarella lobularis]|uniref:large ribosomal subunit protein mL45-like isoform X2 n=1 Tax=Oscarella lobularis TaxID=121494 RepID=UPI00331327F9
MCTRSARAKLHRMILARVHLALPLRVVSRRIASGKFSNRRNPDKAKKRAAVIEAARKRGDLDKFTIRQANMERPITLKSVGQIVNEYTPPEKEYRKSLITKAGWIQRWESLKMKLITTYSIGIIKRYVKPFKVIPFAKEAEKLYCEANSALAQNDKKALLELTTENAYQTLRKEYPNQRISWKFVETLSRPRVVHARVAPLLTKENYFAQVTVRLHTKQILAVYDQLHRLVQGDEHNARNVVDYVVMERHIVEKGTPWRICGKVIPHWKKMFT